MISCMRGSAQIKDDNDIILWVSGIGYEILVPASVMKWIMDKTDEELNDISLVTFHYCENYQTRIIPRLIGFSNTVEREFFELFITVANMGPKTAVKALSKSFHSIAEAIERGDFKELATLPGIGDKKARQIVATLQGKAGKFALLQDADVHIDREAEENIENEAAEVLIQLGYRRSEAQDMVHRATESASPAPKTSEELIQMIYEMRLMR